MAGTSFPYLPGMQNSDRLAGHPGLWKQIDALLLVLTLASFLGTLPASAAVLRVNPDGSGDYPTIQAAVDAAAPLDTIALGPGVFTGAGQVELWMDKALTIRSVEGDPATCTIDGEDLYQALEADAELTVEGVTFRRFYWGLVLYAPATLRNCVFRESGTTVEASFALTVDRCRFLDNTSTALAFFSACSVTDSWFEGNVSTGAYSQGGAIYAEARFNHPTFTGCTFVRNQARRGGVIVIYERGDTPTFTNCTFYQNSAVEVGSIAVLGGLGPESITLDHCLVIGSTGATLVECSVGSAIMDCSISYDNEFGNFPGCLADDEFGHNNLSADPLFCDPLNDDLQVAAESPAAPPNNPCGLIGSQPVGCNISSAPLGPVAGFGNQRLLLVPNPSPSVTAIRWSPGGSATSMNARSDARAVILDAAGRILRELPLAAVENGWETLWDGADQGGRIVPAGIYFVRASAGGRVEARSLVRLPPR